MDWLNLILAAVQGGLSQITRTWQGKVGSGVIAVATLAIVAFLNPIRDSDAPKAQDKEITYMLSGNCHRDSQDARRLRTSVRKHTASSRSPTGR
jgi:hypothetical protein